MPHHLLGQAYRELGRADDADRETEAGGTIADSGKPKA